MEKRAFLLLTVMVLSLVPSAWGLSEPDVTFYPSKITANASFVAVANPNLPEGSDDVVRVEWLIPADLPAGSPVRMGHFPLSGEKLMCYFSGTDSSSTCGPSPFIATSTELGADWQMQVASINQDLERATKTYDSIQVGGIEVTSSHTTIYSDRNVSVLVSPKRAGTSAAVAVEGVTYSAYDSSMGLVNTGQLVWDETGWYKGNVTLPSNGNYFIVFQAEEAGGTDFGGGAVQVSIGGLAGGGGDYVVDTEEIVRSLVFSSSTQTYQELSSYNLENTGQYNLTNLSVGSLGSIDDYIEIVIDNPDDVLEPGQSTLYGFRVTDIPSDGLSVNTWADVIANLTEDGAVVEENAVVGQISLQIGISVTGGGAADACEGKADGQTCPGGKCVLETCITGGYDCLSDDDCSAGEECLGLMCVSGGGCSAGSTCYEGTSSADCPQSPLTVFTGKTCDYEGSDGVCCKVVECIDDTACTSSEPYCSGSPNYACVECVTNSHCTDKYGSGYTCTSGSCQIESATCSTGTCMASCPSGYTQTGQTCDLSPQSDPGANDGVCCRESGATGGGSDIMPLIFIIAIIAIIGLGVWYYFKKFRKGGRKKKSKEEEDLEKELQDEF